jgi:hypothetical protein
MSDQIRSDLTAYFRDQDKLDSIDECLSEYYQDAMDELKHECRAVITCGMNGAITLYRGDRMVDDAWLDDVPDVMLWIVGKMEAMANKMARERFEMGHQ